MTTEISRDELKRALEGGEVVLLEALPPEYFHERHIAGAENLPLDDLETLAPRLIPGPDSPVVTYCSDRTCTNSSIAAERLEALGYTNVRVYEAGKADWVGAGLGVGSGEAPAR